MRNTNGRLPAYFREYLDERFDQVYKDIADIKTDISNIKTSSKTFSDCAEGFKHDLTSFTWRVKIISYMVGGVALLFLVHIGINDGIIKYAIGLLGL